MVNIVDTHAHIFVDDFEDKDNLIALAKENGLEYILMPNIDLASVDQVHDLISSYPNFALGLMGLHPSSVDAEYKVVLSQLKILFDANKYFGVGEIGLDFYWSKEFRKEQIEALEIQLQWAVDMNLPVSLHTRDATDETISICRNFNNLRGVFHCFGGTVEQAEDIVNLGMYLGIGGVLTFKNAGLDKVIKQISMDYLVLETDAPYLAPHPNRGKQNNPAYLKIIAQKLAEVKGVDVEEVARITTANAKSIFKLS